MEWPGEWGMGSRSRPPEARGALQTVRGQNTPIVMGARPSGAEGAAHQAAKLQNCLECDAQ